MARTRQLFHAGAEMQRRHAGLMYLWILIGAGYGLYAQTGAPEKVTGGQLTLKSPPDGYETLQGPVTFSWMPLKTSGTVVDSVDYHLVFQSEATGFESMISVTADDSTEPVTYHTDEIRSLLKRHGKYIWQVTARDSTGNVVRSPGRSIYVGLDIPREKTVLQKSNFGFYVKYLHKPLNDEYRTFLKDLEKDDYLRSCWNFGIWFRQEDILFRWLDFEQQLFVISQLGMGCDVIVTGRLFENTYMAVSPVGSGSLIWIAEGLNHYANRMYEIRLGMELAIMPGEFLTFQGHYIPFYRFHYESKTRGVHTYDGRGWDAGIRIVLPQTIVPTFTLFGLEVNMQRLPLDIHFGQVYDGETDVHIQFSSITLNYLF